MRKQHTADEEILIPRLIACETCDAGISPRAAACPRCGEPTASLRVGQLLAGGLVLVAAGFFSVPAGVPFFTLCIGLSGAALLVAGISRIR